MKNKRGPWSGHPVRWFSLTALCGIRYSGYGAGSSRSSRAILEAESSLASVGSEATPVAVYAPVESALLSIHNWPRPHCRNASCRGSGTLPRTPTATPMLECSTWQSGLFPIVRFADPPYSGIVATPGEPVTGVSQARLLYKG